MTKKRQALFYLELYFRTYSLVPTLACQIMAAELHSIGTMEEYRITKTSGLFSSEVYIQIKDYISDRLPLK
jgi:hypothetical protein